MSEIRYLQQLREDLMEVAWDHTLGRKHGRPGRPKRPSARDSRWVAIAATLTILLSVAGGIGFLATMNGGEADRRAVGSVDGGGVGGEGEEHPAVAPADGGARFVDSDSEGYLSGGDEAVRSQGDGDARAPSAQPEGADEGTEGSPLGGGTGVRPPDDLSKIIRTAELRVVVPNGEFEDRFRDAVSVAATYGGYVESSSTSGRSGSVRIRVPAGRFDAAVRDLSELGTITRHDVRGQDVTGKFVDHKARLKVLRIRRGVILDLMQDATTIDSRLRLQREFEDVQLTIEEIQGQLKVLSNQVSKATITLSMREKDAPAAQPRTEVTKPSLLTAWERSVAGFLAVLGAVVVGLGYLIPIAVIVGAAWLLRILVRRRGE